MKSPALWLLLLVLACGRAAAQGVADPPLTVEALVCRGNASTSCTFILGQVYLAEGDVVDEEELQNARLRLLFLRNFESVSIYLEKGSARGRARIVVEVTEANPLTTELSLDLFSLDHTYGETLSGRATHYNLFGAGKIMDVRASATLPLDGPQIREYFVRAQYIDPHVLDSKRLFFTAGASWLDNADLRPNGDQFRTEQTSYDVTFGYRVWSFSYFTAGYQVRPVANRLAKVRQSDGNVATSTGRRSDVLAYGFGWNSEDDAYFPTRGSRLEASVIDSGDQPESSSVLVRQTWSWRRSVWTAQYEKDNIFGLSLALPFEPRWDAADIRRSRWFVRASVEPNGFTEHGQQIRSFGTSAGVLLESKRFGIVQFTLSYSKDLYQ